VLLVVAVTRPAPVAEGAEDLVAVLARAEPAQPV